MLVLDGEPGPWLPDGFEVIAQRGDGFGERLANAVRDVGEPLLMVGMDTPQLTRALLAGALERLDEPAVDAVLGPTPDGGYWAIGLAARRPARVRRRADEHAADRRRASARGCASWACARRSSTTLRDVDTFDDAAAVAALAPWTRFAGHAGVGQRQLE